MKSENDLWTKAHRPLAAHVRNFQSFVWWLFLVLSGLMFLIVLFRIGPEQVRATVHDAGLNAVLIQFLQTIDVLWITLAAVNTYVFVAQMDGIATARRWSLIILLGSSLLAWIGAETRVPFGPIAFTDNLGARIGHVVPFGVPLLWLVVVLNSRYAARACLPRSRPWQLALVSGVITLIVAWLFERLASHGRFYWLWHPLEFRPDAGAPLQNYMTWFVAAFAFTALARESRVSTASRRQLARRPLATLGALAIVSLAAW